MGSTFGILHVRNIPAEKLLETVVADLEKQGFRRVSRDAAAGSMTGRRIAVWQNGRKWCSFFDDGFSNLLSNRGLDLSKHFGAPVVSMAANDSDKAWMSLFDNGVSVGSVEIPKDATPRADGKKVLLLKWLVPYAVTSAGAKHFTDGIPGVRFLAELPLEDIGRKLGIKEPVFWPDEDEALSLFFVTGDVPKKRLRKVVPTIQICGGEVEAGGIVGKRFETLIEFRQSTIPEHRSITVRVSGSGVRLLDLEEASLVFLDDTLKDGRRIFKSKVRKKGAKLVEFEINNINWQGAPTLQVQELGSMSPGKMNVKRLARIFDACSVFFKGRGKRAGDGELTISIGYTGVEKSFDSETLPLSVTERSKTKR